MALLVGSAVAPPAFTACDMPQHDPMVESVDAELAGRVGDTIRRLRRGRGLSVAALAARSGLSRRMLTQVELGQANPSLAALDRIAAGLRTTFATLVGVADQPPPAGVRVWTESSGNWGSLLSVLTVGDALVELWKCRLVAGQQREFGLESTTAGDAVVHHVLEGAVEIRTDGREYRAAAGESATVPLHAPRTYRAPADDAVFFMLVPQPAPPAEWTTR